MLDLLKDHVAKALIAALITVSAGLYHFITNTQTRLALLEYRMAYSVGPPPWEKK